MTKVCYSFVANRGNNYLFQQYASATSYPKVSGGGQPYLSNDANQVLANATTVAKDMGDEYIAIEHLLLAFLKGKDKVAQMLKDAGVKENETKQEIYL